MADTFTQDKLIWLEQASIDPGISPAAFRTAFVISTFVNRATGEAWPSLGLLAAARGTDEKTVRRSINELVEAGYLGKRRGGNGTANRYRMVISDRTKMSDLIESRPDKNVQSENDRPDIIAQSDTSRLEKNVHPDEEQIGHSCPSDRTFLSQQTGQKCPPNTFIEPFEELSEEKESPPTPSQAKEAEGIIAEFEGWYLHYPRKVGKKQAELAYRRARKSATAAELMAGVMRYAAERDQETDPHRRAKFTAHPSSWLNAGRWADHETIPKAEIVPLAPRKAQAGMSCTERAIRLAEGMQRHHGSARGAS